MAVDHALLEGVGLPGAVPAIRLYGFSPPTLSLGRFQKADQTVDRAAAERDGVVVVRRPTGGQAVLHDGELTYAVILARTHLEPFSKREVYRFVARALMGALAALGIPVNLAGSRAGDLHNPDCFRTTGEYELQEGGRKLVGSAQIVSRHGALQHGSIPLDGSHRKIVRYLRASEPATAGPEGLLEHVSVSIAELTGERPSFATFRDRLAREIDGILDTYRDELSGEERCAAQGALDRTYGSDTWTFGV
jgi:lipoate-protein ligase A